MKFCSLASGSSGNCQYIETKEKKILIDGGLSGKAIENNLRAIGVDPATLDAIFVTHEHNDHVKGVGILARRYHLEVFANENTWLAMEKTVKHIDEKKRAVFESRSPSFTGTFRSIPCLCSTTRRKAAALWSRRGTRRSRILPTPAG